MKYIRSPIVSVLGHVDHGKTKILDRIRGSNVVEKEPGRITQMVGASLIKRETIEKLGGEIRDVLKFELHIPGLLFIDTPGHEVFTSLRERGGSIADIAILVVDIMQGIQPQTIESIELLKEYKTPFVVAANKIDLLDGWKETKRNSVLLAMKEQRQDVQQKLDEKIYELMGQLSEYGFNSELFTRVRDFTKEISIVPVSAMTGEGISELLLLVAGLSEKYLKDKLYIGESEKPQGTVMEVKEERGLGITVDALLYDGVLKEGDKVYFMTKEKVVERRVRAILIPNVSSNNPKEKYKRVKNVAAAAGVKIAAPNLEGVLAGSPFGGEKKELEAELKSLIFTKEGSEGVVAKADSLGSAEALVRLLEREKIPVSRLEIGHVTKEDIMFASTMKEAKHRVILAFNLTPSREMIEESKKLGVKIIASDIIYKLPENYDEYVKELGQALTEKMLERIPAPAKIEALPGFFFRLSKPAVFGVRVLKGTLRSGVYLMGEDGEVIGQIKSIQEDKQSIRSAEEGKEVAISVEGAILKKDINEGDTLYVYLNKNEIEAWKKSGLLDEENQELLKEIEKITTKYRLNKARGR